MDDISKTIEYFQNAEQTATEILNLKEEILNLHKKMNEYREALAYVSKNDFEKGYMYNGAILVQQNRQDMIKKLQKNFKEVNEEIREKGDQIKEKVYKLQDIEKQTPYAGKSLIPLDKTELAALSQVWGNHAT